MERTAAIPCQGSEGGAGGSVFSVMRGGPGLLIQMAQQNGSNKDAGVRQDLARLYTLAELGRFNSLRLKGVRESGSDIPGMPNLAKLSMSQIVRLTREIGLRIIGAGGMLHAYDDADRRKLVEATGRPLHALVTELALLSPAPTPINTLARESGAPMSAVLAALTELALAGRVELAPGNMALKL